MKRKVDLLHNEQMFFLFFQRISLLKCALNLHFIFIKKVQIGHWIWCLFILCCWCCLLNNSWLGPLEGSGPASTLLTMMLNLHPYNANLSQIAQKVFFLHHSRKLVQIRCHKLKVLAQKRKYMVWKLECDWSFKFFEGMSL